MIATKIQNILLKWLPHHPHFHMRLMFNFNVLSVFKCCFNAHSYDQGSATMLKSSVFEIDKPPPYKTVNMRL